MQFQDKVCGTKEYINSPSQKNLRLKLRLEARRRMWKHKLESLPSNEDIEVYLYFYHFLNKKILFISSFPVIFLLGFQFKFARFFHSFQHRIFDWFLRYDFLPD